MRSVSIAEPAADEESQKLAEQFIASDQQAHSLDAVKLGNHEQDGRFLPRCADEKQRLSHFAQALESIDPQRLSSEARYDWRLLRQAIAKEVWRLEVQRFP